MASRRFSEEFLQSSSGSNSSCFSGGISGGSAGPPLASKSARALTDAFCWRIRFSNCTFISSTPVFSAFISSEAFSGRGGAMTSQASSSFWSVTGCSSHNLLVANSRSLSEGEGRRRCVNGMKWFMQILYYHLYLDLW